MQKQADTTPNRSLYRGWAVGTFGVSMMLNLQNVAMMFFFVTVLKIDPGLAGTLIFVSKIYDAFTDPVMGRISDATTSRWGRRRPYLLAGSIICGASIAALFAVPDLSPKATEIYVLVILLIVATGYTIFNVPYLAMPAEMVEDYHERSVMMSYRVFLIAIGTFLATSGAPALLSLLQVTYGMSQRASYTVMGLAVGSVVTLAMVLAFFGTRKAPVTREVKTAMSIGQQLQLLAGNTPFLLYMGLKLCGLFALAATLAAKFFFITYVMQQELAIAAIFGTASLVGQLVSLPVWLRISKKVGKKAILIYSSILQIAITATWFFSGPDESMFIYGLRGFLLGIGGSGTLLGTQAMLPDVMEYDYRRTGLRREGVYAGLASFIEKLAFSLSAPVIGFTLVIVGFDRNAETQSDMALLGITACLAILPMLMYSIKLVLLAFYDLDEKKLKSTAPPDVQASGTS